MRSRQRETSPRQSVWGGQGSRPLPRITRLQALLQELLSFLFFRRLLHSGLSETEGLISQITRGLILRTAINTFGLIQVKDRHPILITRINLSVRDQGRFNRLFSVTDG